MTRTQLKVGFVRLSDVAPLAAALTRGTFKAHGLDVSLLRFSSWAALRDALGTNIITAAHMLSPMVVASAAGLGPFPGEFTTGFIINLNGNAITVSHTLFDQMQSSAPGHLIQLPLTASALKTVISMRRETGKPRLTFAHVYPYSMHAYQLRYWLGAAGINPDRDVELVVIPPAQMVNALTRGEVDGYCVGEPWNSAAVVSGVGRTLITSWEIWSNSPEKALAVRRDWAERHEDTHIALISALLEAAAWVDRPENRIRAAEMVASPEIIDSPLDEIVGSLTGNNRQIGGRLRVNIPDFNIFHRYAANFPWRSHAKWILSQMQRWGELPDRCDIEAASTAAFRPDIFRKAALDLGVPCPNQDEKIEGAHGHAWLMTDASAPIAFGSDRFLDNRVFDPEQIDAYVASFQV